MKRIKIMALLLVILLVISGCSWSKNVEEDQGDGVEETPVLQESEKEEENQKIAIDYQTVRPNELGDILVVMYHGLVESDPPSIWQRTMEGFKKDLAYMYEKGYRPISMKNYLENDISVEAGYTPIVITFDDSLSSTYSLKEGDNGLIPNPDTAVDIMNEFAQEHPDFGKAAIFFMNANPFLRDSLTGMKGDGELKERVDYLLEQGYEIGNHTFNHEKLNKMNGTEIQEEIGRINNMVKDVLPEAPLEFFSYPFGLRPKEEWDDLIQTGSYEGQEYYHRAAVREAPRSPYFVPAIHKDFQPYNIPRTIGTEGNQMDLWWYFTQYEKKPEKRYVSDGNPNQISIPKELEDKIDTSKLGDKELYLYEIEE